MHIQDLGSVQIRDLGSGMEKVGSCSATATISYPASLSNPPNGHPRRCLSAGPPVDYRTGSKLCSDAPHFYSTIDIFENRMDTINN